MHMMMQGQATVGPPRCGSMGTPFRALPIPSPRLPGSVRRSDWVANTPSQTASKACRWKLAAVKSSQTLETADTDLIQLISDISKDVDSRHAGLLRDAKGATPDIEGLDSSLRGKAQTAILSLQSGLLERETEVRLLLLAALCGEHLLLLGPPGTAKSELSRRLAELTGGRYFERLLTRFSVPEELFGPLSMKGLENDLYERQTSGYLPTAEVAFIDEVFKANSAILNALLTILNERLFSNGSARLEVPLLCLVGASNELPESEELDALYDRFLLRRQVAQVSSAQLGNLARLAAGSLRATTQTSADGAGAAGGRLELADFHGTASTAYSAVEVPDSVIDLLTTTRDYLQDKCEPPIYVSDRRFMKAIKMLQVAAHVDGRSAVHEYDCLLLEFVLGSRPDDSQKVRAFVLETIASDPGLQQLELVFLGLFGRACRALEGGNEQDVAEAQQEASQLVELLDLRQGSVGLTLDGGFADLGATIWQSEGSVREAVQVLTPPMTENRKKAEDLLREALLLQTALQRQVAASALERILPKRYKQYQKGVSGRV
ncbi:hypothetical protein ACKKBG_A29945 [Auxenochlorella protothecoides x Auxenochlorella symbiontica]